MLKISTIFLLLLLLSLQLNAQIAAGKCKFLGNIIGYSVPEGFNTYWNQVTPENAGKWGSVESTRDYMNWTALDRVYNHAKNSVLPFKQHTFVWGQQQPGWIESLSQDDQRAEVEEWIQLFGERYQDADFIDVVNEPLHAVPSYSAALGGSGTTGWDWVVWSFEKARQYCPNAKLLLNDYGIISSTSATDQYLTIIDTLQAKGLIDGIGVQGHFLESADTAIMRSNLDRLAETGLPVYISEYDVNIAEDALQFQKYFEQFPVLWKHPGVAGITLWGYIQGRIWRQDAYLVRTDGSERPAMSWLKTYVMTTSTGCVTSDVADHSFADDPDIYYYPNPATNGSIIVKLTEGITELRIAELSGRVIKEVQLTGQPKLTFELDVIPGLYLLQFVDGQKSVVKKLMVK